MSTEEDRRAAEELRELLESLRDVLALEAEGKPASISDRQLQLATGVLCLSVLRADMEHRQDEHRVLRRTVQRVLGLDEEQTRRVIRLAEEEAKLPKPLQLFVSLIDRAYDADRKRHIVQELWRVAYADAELQGHEEYLIRKIADLLHLSTADLVEAKVRAREAFLREDL